jgi:hypothetical protein
MTITEDLIQRLRDREAQGVRTYGETLRPHNGRDACQDLIEELLDAAQYTRQWQIERAAMLEAIRKAEMFIDPKRVWPQSLTMHLERRDYVLAELRAVLTKESE